MNILGHFETITRHKLLVMKYCFECGLYEQGLAHDLSKYSPTEFIPGCIYYQGDHSPNEAEREAKGYSSAWLHHKGRNKHHLEYWIDYSTNKSGMTGMKMPLRYVCEMICDRVAASQIYLGEKYTDASPWEYYEHSKDHYMLHPETRALLETKEPLELVDEALIPALDIVGNKYEKGTLFLPQLLQAASAAQSAFEEIKTAIAKKGAANESKGRIVIATVKGDVHDIGKNIVKVILENYGFEVIDLGRDVPVETVVNTVREKDVHLVGLSALMTTTLKSMEETIAALHEAKLDCKIMVGGAVLTPEYAKKIGADWYAKDAKRSADIAKEFFGV